MLGSSTAHQSDPRWFLRRELALDAPVELANSRFGRVQLSNLSETGFLAHFESEITVGQFVRIELPAIGWLDGEVVWSSGNLAGCRLATRLSKGAISAAILQSEPARETASILTTTHDRSHAKWDTSCEAQDDEKLPLRTRALSLLGLAAVSWAATIAIFRLLL